MWYWSMVEAAALGSKSNELLHQRKVSASGSDDNEVHDDKHRVVAPSICSRFTPETGLPDENLFPDRAEHDQNQADGSELSEEAKDQP